MSEQLAEIDKGMALAEWRIEDMVRREKGEHSIPVGTLGLMADTVEFIEYQPADFSKTPSAIVSFRDEGSLVMKISHTPGGESSYAYGHDKLKPFRDAAHKKMLFNLVADGIVLAKKERRMTPVDQQG